MLGDGPKTREHAEDEKQKGQGEEKKKKPKSKRMEQERERGRKSTTTWNRREFPEPLQDWRTLSEIDRLD